MHWGYCDNKTLILKAEPDSPENYDPSINNTFSCRTYKFRNSKTFIKGLLCFETPLRKKYTCTVFIGRLHNMDKGKITMSFECSIGRQGFQYPVFCFGKMKILLLSRTAWISYHTISIDILLPSTKLILLSKETNYNIPPFSVKEWRTSAL